MRTAVALQADTMLFAAKDMLTLQRLNRLTMGKEPVNIQRLVRENQKHSDAVTHAHDILTATNAAAWYTRDFEQAHKSDLTMQTKDFAAPDSYIIERQKVGARDQIAQELQVR